MYMKQLVGSCHIARELNWVLSDDLEGWDGGWVGGTLKKEGNMYTYS